MKQLLIILVILTPCLHMSQSLGKERIKKINSTIVQITIDSVVNKGTGFIISKNGIIVTCKHLIDKAYYLDENDKKTDSLRNIKAHFDNGNVIDLIIVDTFIKNKVENINGTVYDYILLQPKEQSNTNYDFLEIGKWEEINEGDEVYTAGYMLSENKRVVSKGILSTKFTDINKLKKTDGTFYNVRYNTAWTDITSNKGNSGAPLIKLGKSCKEDKVVGIIFRNLNPFVDNLTKYIKENKDLNGKNTETDSTTNKTIAFILDTLAYNYYGFAGVNPAENILSALSLLNQ